MSSSSHPLVSVGLVTYRRPEGLRKVLQSLGTQTYRNLEIVVSDNCSESAEVDAVLGEFEAIDQRIRLFRQPFNIGMEPNHTFVVRQATGELFLWLHDDDDIPDNYIERCVERFADASQIELVGPRAEAYMEGRYWYTYWNYSNVGQGVYERLRDLIPLGYRYSSAFQQYFYGVFRLKTLKDLIWEDGSYFHKETYSLFFRISERGYIHFVEDVTLKKYNVRADFKKWRDKNYVDKPRRWKFAGSKIEELIPMTLNIFGTVLRSQKLGHMEKISLVALCSYHFLRAALRSRVPLWKRILRAPFRLVRKLFYLANRAMDAILRA